MNVKTIISNVIGNDNSVQCVKYGSNKQAIYINNSFLRAASDISWLTVPNCSIYLCFYTISGTGALCDLSAFYSNLGKVIPNIDLRAYYPHSVDSTFTSNQLETSRPVVLGISYNKTNDITIIKK